MLEKNVCPNPIGYFTMRGDKDRINKYPAPCDSWTCPVCGPRKKRKFLFSVKCATSLLMSEGYRIRGLTVTLGQDARNSDLGKYWHRFMMALKKAGYRFEYLWVKEFQKNGKLHMHALITSFIPWNVIKYYWRMATEDTSFVVWIANAQIKYSAAYISKYIAKNFVEAPFSKGERRYGMSKGLRKKWPKFDRVDDEFDSTYVFWYKPDNSVFIKNARKELSDSIKRREAWKEETGLKGKSRKHLHYRIRKHTVRHVKSNLV